MNQEHKFKCGQKVWFNHNGILYSGVIIEQTLSPWACYHGYTHSGGSWGLGKLEWSQYPEYVVEGSNWKKIASSYVTWDNEEEAIEKMNNMYKGREWKFYEEDGMITGYNGKRSWL